MTADDLLTRLRGPLTEKIQREVPLENVAWRVEDLLDALRPEAEAIAREIVEIGELLQSLSARESELRQAREANDVLDAEIARLRQQLAEREHARKIIGVEYDNLFQKLLEPVDQGGYDGFAVDGLHAAAAKAITDLIHRAATELEMHTAWRKRAEESERAELKADASRVALRQALQRLELLSRKLITAGQKLVVGPVPGMHTGDDQRRFTRLAEETYQALDEMAAEALLGATRQETQG